MSNINKSIFKKLLSFPLKLSLASEMLIKDQNAKVKWNVHVFMYEQVIFSQLGTVQLKAAYNGGLYKR